MGRGHSNMEWGGGGNVGLPKEMEGPFIFQNKYELVITVTNVNVIKAVLKNTSFALYVL